MNIEIKRTQNQLRSAWIAAATAFVVLVTSNCTFRRPAIETPPPSGVNDSLIRVEKSFFVGKDKTGRKKRFIFGMAPERELGFISQMVNIHGVPEFKHANLEFEITEKFLIGLKVNPSYPNDRSQWQPLIKIPIVSHYYYERAKDANGRDTNEYIENTERSHYSARPRMKIDVGGSQISSMVVRDLLWNSTTSVTDVELDIKEDFIGFSARVEGAYSQYNQTVYRINLKGFEKNPQFKTTPFHEQNYKHMNVLHVMGQKTETQDQILFAAHWDLSKQRTIHLVGFPDEYVQLGVDTVEAWNRAFQEIGAVPAGFRPFVAKVREMKHPFDLRYVTMHWVSDIRISLNSPLGVGVTTADVENGEIQWGKVTAFGGFIEAYLKANMAPKQVSAVGKLRFFDGFFDKLGLNKIFSTPPELQSLVAATREQFAHLTSDRLMQRHASTLNAAIQRSDARAQQEELQRLAVQGGSAKISLEKNSLQITPEHVRALYEGMQQGFADFQGQGATAGLSVGQISTTHGMQDYIGKISEIEAHTPAEKFLAGLHGLPASDQFQQVVKKFTRTDCADRTFADVIGGWSKAMKAGGTADTRFLLENMIYELLLHEMGHMIGLGHQFKENIVPAEGTVPETIRVRLAGLATAENGYSNYTSVMGYRSPKTEIESYLHAKRTGLTRHVDVVVPGEQDKLVLRYLYKQEFALYAPGLKDFQFLPVPKNGILPSRVKNLKIAYFPQCNDAEASYGLDPFCNRFDRGSDAKTIVSSYFDDLKDNLIQRLIAFSDTRSSDAFESEYYLLALSMRSFSRVRVFYDYMRAKLETELPEETRLLLQNEEALYAFSSACSTGQAGPRVADLLNRIFTKKPFIKELCEVNQLALKELTKVLSLSVADHSKVDFDNYFFPAGITGGEVDFDYSKVFGTWKELGAFPMKLAALYSLQAATPFVTFGAYAFPIPNYDTPERRYAYVSLYPREFTEAQTAVVKNNLRFANVHFGERTRIGKSVLYMGILPYLIGAHNDASRLPPQFVERLRSQLKFNIGYVAVLMKKAEDPHDKYIAKKFNPTVFDLNNGKEANASEAFLLPEGDVIVRAENSFLVPTSKFQFLGDDLGFVYAYRLTFYEDDDDVLNSVSTKTALKDLHDQTLAACLRGKDNEQNGLSAYFTPTNEDFKGFYVPPNISVDKDKQRQFRESIRESFLRYYDNVSEAGTAKFTVAPAPSSCQEAIRGLRMVVSAAALLNGYWLPKTDDFIEN